MFDRMNSDKKDWPDETLFSNYVKDNNFSLTGLGVVATITALFLNLNTKQYSQSLIEIQTVLMVLLLVASIYVAITTAQWINSNCDGWFSSIISGLTFLLPFYEAKFLYENFRDEISSLMSLFLISVSLGLIFFWNKHVNQITSYINNKIRLSNMLVFPVLNTIGITVVFSLIEIYKKFMKDVSIDIISILIEVATGPFVKIMFALSLFTEFILYRNYLNLGRKTALYASLLVTCLVVGYYIIVYIF